MDHAPPPENGAHNRIAFKTGTSYGYRDAWSVGFDGKITIGVWVGRPDGAPVPGLVGRVAAAPILFDAFARTGKLPAPLAPAPRGTLVAATGKLPPPLQPVPRRPADRAPAVVEHGQRPDRCVRHRGGWIGGRRSGPLFTSRKGSGRLTPRAVQHLVKRAAAAASLPDPTKPRKYHPHVLRHSFCTEKIRRRVPLPYVQRLMRHNNIQTTMRYTHVVPEDLRDAIEA